MTIGFLLIQSCSTKYIDLSIISIDQLL